MLVSRTSKITNFDNMPPLILDEATRTHIRRACHLAIKNPDGTEFIFRVAVGIVCCFSLQQRPNGLHRVLSVRLRERRWPSCEVVRGLMPVFGFRGTLTKARIKATRLQLSSDPNTRSILLLQPVSKK